MKTDTLGAVFQDGDVIISQGDEGDCMYAIQDGHVEVIKDGHLILSTLGPGDLFGEMALFQKERRGATVRVKGRARVLTIDKRTLLRRIQEDPSIAFRLIEKLSNRVRDLNSRLSELEPST